MHMWRHSSTSKHMHVARKYAYTRLLRCVSIYAQRCAKNVYKGWQTRAHMRKCMCKHACPTNSNTLMHITTYTTHREESYSHLKGYAPICDTHTHTHTHTCTHTHTLTRQGVPSLHKLSDFRPPY